MVLLDGFFDELVELSCGDAAVLLLVDFFDRFEEPVEVSAR